MVSIRGVVHGEKGGERVMGWYCGGVHTKEIGGR